ncbi:hypothetical protein TcBrA4_0129470 [Trypanosoma cruzi]|nr:hypothetical protein TcBrA4_0129470 [Trypanosoma cruzi]
MLQRKLLAAFRAKLPPRSEKSGPLSSHPGKINTTNPAAPPTPAQWNASAGPMTTPYGAQIDHYIRDLEAHFKNSSEAMLDARKAIEGILTEQAKARQEHCREYLLTFVPLVFTLILFLREQINRSCAEQTHLFLKEHADKCSSLKRVVL